MFHKKAKKEWMKLKAKNSKKKIIITLCLMVSVFTILQVFFNRDNISLALSKYGSRGQEVTQIQTKLKRWGYYKGNIDGIYGSQTLEAVKYFQRKNGLVVDGIAGKNTLAAMGIFNSSGNSSGSSSNNSSDLNLLSRVVYGEARGEPYEGQVAVAAVVLNRVKSSSFPNTISGVVYQSGAFDIVRDGQINLTPNSTAKKAAQDAYNGWDPSRGAIYYFNPSTATSKWIWSRPMTVTIGRHRFCK
ncbi:MAG: spore cortex-lytic enzyme [Clostridia bacterium]